MDLNWLSNLTKPFSSLLNPIAERIGNWIGRRKPRLYVHFNHNQILWDIAKQTQRDGKFIEMMQVIFWADFNHDDQRETLVITNAYPKGTKPQIGMIGNFAIPPRQIVRQQVAVFVLPIKGEKGRPWVGRFVLVDQFQRKYKTKKVAFRWMGPLPSASTQSAGVP